MTTKDFGLVLSLLAGCGVVMLASGVAHAQDQGWRPPAAPAPAPGRAPQQTQQRSGAPAASARPPSETPPRTDAQMRQRIEELEKEMIDMHVLVGTLQSMAGQGGGAGGGGYAAPLTGQEASRISALETQVQALAIQVEQLTQQIRSLTAGAGGSPDPRRPGPGIQKAPPAVGGFGATVVKPGLNEPADEGAAMGRQAALGPTGGAGGPSSKLAYEAAYARLLQQDYDGAESGFSEFLARYPGDGLAANAQYWLGETYYLQGRWDAAAQAFYKVAQSYASSVKAPDSLAKLAMSLERNGKRPAACAALGELNKRYPNPPAHVKGWEQAERRRAGCT